MTEAVDTFWSPYQSPTLPVCLDNFPDQYLADVTSGEICGDIDAYIGDVYDLFKEFGNKWRLLNYSKGGD
jgi:hypothetical protein